MNIYIGSEEIAEGIDPHASGQVVAKCYTGCVSKITISLDMLYQEYKIVLSDANGPRLMEMERNHHWLLKEQLLARAQI